MPVTTVQETATTEAATSAAPAPSKKVKREPVHRKSQTAKVLEAAANAADVKAKKEKAVLTPSQVLSTLAEKMPNRTEVTSIGQELMEAFSHDTESKIDCGRLLDKAMSAWGENWPSFRDKFVVGSLRKSTDTISNYIALYRAFALEFARASAEFRHALRRIWSAERCFDRTNGELKTFVREAIASIGGMGVLEKADTSEVASVLAAKFVDICDTLSRTKRQGSRQWTAETIADKKIKMVKAFGVFAEKTSTNATIALLHALIYKAATVLSMADLENTYDEAVKEYVTRRQNAAATAASEANKKAA